MAIKGVNIVFHVAALKHVPSCEYNPFEAIKTNVVGLQNVIDLCLSEGVEKLINVSTDKATNPTNVMGSTKLLGERLIAAGHYHREVQGPVMSCVRFRERSRFRRFGCALVFRPTRASKAVDPYSS